MRSLFSTYNQHYLMMVFFAGFLLLALIYRGEGLSDAFRILLTVVSFVFGFYITSLISMSRDRQSNVVEALREEGGTLEAIYLIIKGVFTQPVVDEVRKEIDSYLTATMDYKRTDYAMSSRQFQALFKHITKLETENSKQETAWRLVVEMMGTISTKRSRTEALVKEHVSAFEWMTTGILLALVIFFVYSLNTSDWLAMVITSFVATSLCMLVIILRGLDSLVWKEEDLFWRPLEELFIDLDLPPYYPAVLVREGRVKLPRSVDARIVSYPKPYPDMSGKVITIHKAEG